MKKLILFLLALAIVSVACNKDDDDDDDNKSSLSPKQEQYGFAINYTAKWCGPCGSWGVPLIHDYATAAPNGAVICAHASGDPMHNATLYTAFTADRTTGGGIPSFWIGDTKTTNGSAMAGLLATAAEAGVDLSFEVSGSDMNIKTKTEFFGAGTGDYYLSVLVLEDGIDGGPGSGAYEQNGGGAGLLHDFVLRAAAGNIAYGELITSNPSSGKTVEKDYTIPLDASWIDVYPVAIIWNYDSSGNPKYMFVNSKKKK